MKSNKSIDGLSTRAAKKNTAPNKKNNQPLIISVEDSSEVIQKDSSKIIEEDSLQIDVISDDEKHQQQTTSDVSDTLSREQAIEDFLTPVQALNLDEKPAKKTKKSQKSTKKEKKKPKKARRIITTISLVIVLFLIGFISWAVLWGNDIVSQSSKTPEQILEDNNHLSNYNVNLKSKNKLAILKTYNNQDGEFRSIDQYPGQLGENGALYKWFKYKFLPGGKFAQRPVLYVDGDESFTKTGIEHVIGEEVSMTRENNIEFYKKFDAIDRFVKNHNVITDGEAQIILQDDDGFAAWMISKEPLKKAFLIISNYKNPEEKISKTDENGNSYVEIEHGNPIENKKLQLPGEFKIKSEFVIDGEDFVKSKYKTTDNTIEVERLEPGDFRVFGIEKG